jgi:Trk K+ transport system NAD-binding subunit
VLAGALVAFGLADAIATEAGIAAVATAGITLGNLDVPYESDIEEFKGDITLIVLSFVFIALAALLQIDDLIALGLPGLAVVAVVVFIVRPVLVAISTTGNRFTTGERLFMGSVGPRGIIPASVATLFAVELQAMGQDRAATLLVGTVFLVILSTVLFQGGLARYIAEFLDVIPMRVLVIGGGRVGRVLSDRLDDRGENVVIIENDETAIEQARNQGHAVHIGDGTDTDVLRAAGGDNASIVVAATGDDDVNLLVAQLAKSKFDVETVIVRANNPDNVEAFEDLGVRTISSTFATARALDDAIERPALADWLGSIGSVGDVQEMPVTGSDFVGKTVRELGPELPGNCLVVLVSRNGETQVPEADFELQEDDRITVIGDRDDVRDVMNRCNPEA